MLTGLRAAADRNTRLPLRRLTCLSAVAVWAGILAAPLAAEAASTAKLEREGLTHIIVQREPDLSAGQRADLRADAGVDLVDRLPLPRTEVVEAEQGRLTEALALLRSDPRIAYAVADIPLRGATRDPLWGEQWGLENVGQAALGYDGVTSRGATDADVDAAEAWARTLGAGETIAIVDTGIDFNHPEFRGRIAMNPAESGAKATNGIDDDGNDYVDDVRGWDWVGSTGTVVGGTVTRSQDNDPTDGHGHGTHVAGIASAGQDNDEGITGIAPGAQILPLRILDANNGGGSLSSAMAAFAYAGERGVRIVSASLGFDGTRAQAQGLEAVIANYPETVFVFAAGNGSPNHTDPARRPYDMDADTSATARRFYPCALPNANIVCVGASDASDAPARFSNWGRNSVDVHAPGVGIVSTRPGGQYTTMHGTSMAAPLVAGSLALVAASDRSLTVAQLKARMLDTVDGKAGLSGMSVTGGRINAAAATTAPRPVQQPTAPVPVADQSPAPAPAPAPSPAPSPAPAPAPQPVAQAPAGPAATRPSPVAGTTSAPLLSSLTLSGRTLRKKLTVRFRLDRAATVKLTLARKTCRNRRCTYKSARVLTVSGRPGDNRATLGRSARERRLPAGQYRLTAQASEAGRRSAARTVALRVR